MNSNQLKVFSDCGISRSVDHHFSQMFKFPQPSGAVCMCMIHSSMNNIHVRYGIKQWFVQFLEISEMWHYEHELDISVPFTSDFCCCWWGIQFRYLRSNPRLIFTLSSMRIFRTCPIQIDCVINNWQSNHKTYHFNSYQIKINNKPKKKTLIVMLLS